MRLQIGSAPDSWGGRFASDPKQPPWRRFLDVVATAGYERLELGPSGDLPTELPTLRAGLTRRGLRVWAGTAMVPMTYGWDALRRTARWRQELA